AYNIAGLSDEQITAEVEMQPGINTFSVALTAGDQRVGLQAEPPVSVAGLRPDGDAGKSYPPAAVDPASIKIRYRKVPDGVTATLSARVYVLARETLSNLSIGLAGTDGIVVPSSIVPVAAVGPGASAPVGMM